MRYLFLDDERIPADVTWVEIGNGKSYYESRGAPWEIVRSFDAAVQWVIDNGYPDVVSFDHDLGYAALTKHDSGLVIVSDATESKSGYDFAKWLVEYDMKTGDMPACFSFTVHSMNPVGAKNIKSYLDNYIKQR